ncbi:MAG: hypothetical protein U0326_27160 [Polyangiales bacterium]
MTKRGKHKPPPSEQLGLAETPSAPEAVTCLGRSFPSDAHRREWYRDQLRERLRDPAFRAAPGCPRGDIEAIVAMSDPPWYTACPNPWIGDFIAAYGRPYDPEERYRRDPFAVDVVEKKTGMLYQAHGYHTKVPYLAILPFVLHYTKPGDVILDGFCGSGMAGVAAQWCADPDVKFRSSVEKRFKDEDRDAPLWGARRAVLNDLSPAATFIAANYNIPFDVSAFEKAARTLLDEVDAELGWMYQTRLADGRVGRIEYTVWSEVFQCGSCAREIVFTEEALDDDTNKVRKCFPCPHCKATLARKDLDRIHDSVLDLVTKEPVRTLRRRPVLIVYEVDGDTFTKVPDADDLALIARVESLPVPSGLPTAKLPHMHMTHERANLASLGVTHLHHFFLPRARHALARMWKKADAHPDARTRLQLRFLVEQSIWGMSVMNRYQPLMHGEPGGSQVNRQQSGIYYVPSQISEVSPRYNLSNRVGRLVKAFGKMPSSNGNVIATTGTCAALPVPDESIDYIFTDPPFGENIYYADLNFLVESFHGVVTDAEPEAIVDRAKKKTLFNYQELMASAFREYHRVLKPGRWITVEFHNQHNHVWHAIQEAMTAAGFMVAAVRTFDKAQDSYRQVTSDTVKLDLLVTAYKATEETEAEFRTRPGDPERVWEIVDQHLRNVPRGLRARDGTMEVVEERVPHKLFDQMVAWFVQRNEQPPMSLTTFRAALKDSHRYSFVDGMYFLPEQVPDYHKFRAKGGEVKQLPLMPLDEASTIEWLRAQLVNKPQRTSDLTPLYHSNNTGWRKHEHAVELASVLQENFLQYEGKGPIPEAIWAWMGKSATLRERMKDAERERPTSALIEHARGLWYVADPTREADIAEVRRQKLLREFATYLESTKTLRSFRTEALRVGFEQAWKDKSYGVITAVADRIPEEVLAEDPRLLTLHRMARTRRGKA